MKDPRINNLAKLLISYSCALRVGERVLIEAIGVSIKTNEGYFFDEKIRVSIHLSKGNAYIESDNGNKSAIHCVLILMQTIEMGGGDIYFDGTLFRKDVQFVL